MKDVKRLFKHLRSYKMLVGLGILCNILTAIFTVVSIPLIMPFFQILFNTRENEIPENAGNFEMQLNSFFKYLIDQFDPQKAIIIVCLLILLTFFFKNLFRYLSLYFMTPVRAGIMQDLRSDLYRQFLFMSPAQIKSKQRGDLITRISADVQEIEWSILQFVQTVFQSPFIILGSICFMLFIDPKLTSLVFILMIIIAFLIGTISRTLKKSSNRLQTQMSSLTSTVEEMLSGKRSINAFQAEGFWQDRFKLDNDGYTNTLINILRRKDLSSPLSEFLGIGVVVILLYLGSNFVLKNAIAPQTFFAFILAFYFVIEPLKSFSTAFYNYKKGIAALDRIEEILGLQNNNSQSTDLQTVQFENEISFEDVRYKFDDTDVETLKGINFTIKKGETIALVGPSGGGKTSLMMLLLKVYKPTSGRILIDGHDLQTIDTSSWRKTIGYVPQEAFIFNDSIEANIRFGRKNHSKGDLENAIKTSYCDIFVNKLEDGYNYNVGDKGNKLSGGEKQRINIARALLNNPEVLLLDEPTSALDAQAEQIVGKAIKDISRKFTAMIIAHRLSTIKTADTILVIEKGEIKEKGNHKLLSEKDNLYSKYLKYQQLG